VISGDQLSRHNFIALLRLAKLSKVHTLWSARDVVCSHHLTRLQAFFQSLQMVRTYSSQFIFYWDLPCRWQWQRQ